LSTMESSQVRLSADVGGTFTDVAAFDETTGELQLGKTLTTPARLVDGIEGGVAKAAANFRAARLFLHGTTVAINTILERTGAPCALITTQGFRDIYEIGRVNRPESQSVLPPPRAADRPRSALRDPRAHRCPGQGADQAR
jgi:N-methylhydantoinase A